MVNKGPKVDRSAANGGNSPDQATDHLFEHSFLTNAHKHNEKALTTVVLHNKESQETATATTTTTTTTTRAAPHWNECCVAAERTTKRRARGDHISFSLGGTEKAGLNPEIQRSRCHASAGSNGWLSSN